MIGDDESEEAFAAFEAECAKAIEELRAAKPGEEITTSVCQGYVFWIVAAATPFEEGAR